MSTANWHFSHETTTESTQCKCPYTTVEGHPIKVGETYVQRCGALRTIEEIRVDEDRNYPLRGDGCMYSERGESFAGSMHDLMRPLVKPQVHTTIEGHALAIGGEYETRDGRVVKILDFTNDSNYPVAGTCEGDFKTFVSGGAYYSDIQSSTDLMRPYVAKPVYTIPEGQGYVAWLRHNRSLDTFKTSAIFPTMTGVKDYWGGLDYRTIVGITRENARSVTEGENL